MGTSGPALRKNNYHYSMKADAGLTFLFDATEKRGNVGSGVSGSDTGT